MRTSSKSVRFTERGFSLIEVLIAVLVLAIGMLGLGAVFPAIIAEQRSSFEVVEGENAAGAAAALLNNKEFVNFDLVEPAFNKYNLNSDEQYQYLWAISPDGQATGWNTQFPGYDYSGGFALDSGRWSFDRFNSQLTGNAFHQAEIPIGARLYPQPYSGAKQPRFVWDLALRRAPGGDRLQAAIFVRRIDARVRVPEDYTLSDVLTGGNGIPQGYLRLPVAVNFATGLPAADDGSGNFLYAAIQAQPVEVYPEHLDWLVFANSGDPNYDTSIGFAAKVGQKLVDNTGVVRTVVGLPEVDPSDSFGSNLLQNNRVVIVDPPFTYSNAGGTLSSNVSGTDLTLEGFARRASWVRQVIFTPRTPVAVRVVNLEGN